MSFDNQRQQKELRAFAFDCPDCGETHIGANSFGYDRPAQCADVPISERRRRITLTNDLCRIAPGRYSEQREPQLFIRTSLEIPIHGFDAPFSWGVWVTQSRSAFERYIDTFTDDQSHDGSFGWLAVIMPGYRRHGADEPLELLGCNVHWQKPGHRPKLSLHESDHPLYRDQKNGISFLRAAWFARLVLHHQ